MGGPASYAQSNELVTAEVLGDHLDIRFALNTYAPYVWDTVDTRMGQFIGEM